MRYSDLTHYIDTLIFTIKVNHSRKALAFYRGGDNEKVRKEIEEIVDAKDTKCQQPKSFYKLVTFSSQNTGPLFILHFINQCYGSCQLVERALAKQLLSLVGWCTELG